MSEFPFGFPSQEICSSEGRISNSNFSNIPKLETSTSIHRSRLSPYRSAKMRNQTGLSFLILLLLLTLLTLTTQFARLADAGKRTVHITDDLDDVVDDEEDEEWREWGKKKQSSSSPDNDDDDDGPPPDFDKMDPAQIQAEMMKRLTGPLFGFVKLRLGVPRTKESVSEIARKWTKVLKTGGTELNFLGIDLGTIMFSMQQGQDAEELKDFILSQPDAYEVKIGDAVFRRPGDPPVEEVIDKIQREESGIKDPQKDEL